MSYKIDIFNQKGDKVKAIDLDKTVFAEENINNDLMYQFVRMQQANARVAIASTKNRGEINGSNKKLYKQKGNGTGRV
jgi:large subunit ribosomal protein L4